MTKMNQYFVTIETALAKILIICCPKKSLFICNIMELKVLFGTKSFEVEFRNSFWLDGLQPKIIKNWNLFFHKMRHCEYWLEIKFFVMWLALHGGFNKFQGSGNYKKWKRSKFYSSFISSYEVVVHNKYEPIPITNKWTG